MQSKLITKINKPIIRIFFLYNYQFHENSNSNWLDEACAISNKNYTKVEIYQMPFYSSKIEDGKKLTTIFPKHAPR
jgi:hypothetical protein